MTTIKIFRRVCNSVLGFCLVALVAGTGCRYLLPAHLNSNSRTGETTEVTFVSRDDLDLKNLQGAENIKAAQDFVKDYLKAFPEMASDKAQNLNDTGFVPLAALAAPIAAAAVSQIFDQVSQQLKLEAELYEQQWEAEQYCSRFWKLSTTNPPAVSREVKVSYEASGTWTTNITNLERLLQNPQTAPTTNITYVETSRESRSDVTLSKYLSFYGQDILGVKIKRYIGGTNREFASELVLGFAPIVGQGMFMIKPISYRCAKAKAKVLGKGSSAFALGLPWVIGKYPGNEIKTSVDVTIEAKWVEKQALRKENIAVFTVQLPNYNISKREKITVGGGLPDKVVGVFAGVPVSLNSKGEPLTETGDKWLKYLGLFKVHATVTEKDVSNAKNRLQDLQKKVDEEKPTVTKQVEGWFK